MHVKISKELHYQLCKLKPSVREYWFNYWKNNPDIQKFYRRRISIEQVIEYLIMDRKY